MAGKKGNPFFDVLRAKSHKFDSKEIIKLFKLTDETRVNGLAKGLAEYIGSNLPAAFERRSGLSDYRTNPYVLMTSASVMKLGDPAAFGSFLFNSKVYMALETSFGKSVESAFVGQYPLNSKFRWDAAPEKVAEAAALEGLSREEKAKKRTDSVWREIDKACVVGPTRYMTSIKSGPNTINDTQVQGMTRAIIDNYRAWAKSSFDTYKGVKGLDLVLGLTYGTDRTTNNKENQVLVKLLEHGFVEEDRVKKPGVLIDKETKSVRIYRRIGKEFWSFIGQPDDPAAAEFVYLEILLGLSKALAIASKGGSLEERINAKLQDLATALLKLQFPKDNLPEWVREEFNEHQLFWFATAMTAFHDEGI